VNYSRSDQRRLKVRRDSAGRVDRVIDGNTDGDFQAGLSVHHHECWKTDPWLELDLGFKSQKHQIRSAIWKPNDGGESMFSNVSPRFRVSLLDENRETVGRSRRRSPRRPQPCTTSTVGRVVSFVRMPTESDFPLVNARGWLVRFVTLAVVLRC